MMPHFAHLKTGRRKLPQPKRNFSRVGRDGPCCSWTTWCWCWNAPETQQTCTTVQAMAATLIETKINVVLVKIFDKFCPCANSDASSPPYVRFSNAWMRWSPHPASLRPCVLWPIPSRRFCGWPRHCSSRLSLPVDSDDEDVWLCFLWILLTFLYICICDTHLDVEVLFFSS